MKHQETPLIQVGKNGLTETVMGHIGKVLHRKKTVKVKFLKSASRENLKETARQLAEGTKATRHTLRGFIVTLWKDR